MKHSGPTLVSLHECCSPGQVEEEYDSDGGIQVKSDDNDESDDDDDDDESEDEDESSSRAKASVKRMKTDAEDS